jgi:hydrogenase maturation factor
MSNEQDVGTRFIASSNVGTRFIASSNHKLIEISPAIHEPDAHPYRVGAGLAPALETVFTANAPTCELDAEGHCITCSDEAVTVQVLQVDSETGIAFVTVQDKTEEVDITLVEDVVPGDWLLVHGGVAIANVPVGAQFIAPTSPNDAGEASDA